MHVDATAQKVGNRLVRVGIANGEPLSRRRFHHMSSSPDDVVVVGEADDLDGALQLVEDGGATPDVIVIDVGLSHAGGIEVARRIHVEHPSVGIVMSGGEDDWRDVAEAVKAGARGYLLDSDEPDRVASTLRVVAAGGDMLEGHRAWLELQERPAPAHERPTEPAAGPDRMLTARQVEVLAELRAGVDDGAAAARLGISASTLRAHERRIGAKLGLADRGAVRAYAARADYLIGYGADYIAIWDLRLSRGPIEWFPEGATGAATTRLRELTAKEGDERDATRSLRDDLARGWRSISEGMHRAWRIVIEDQLRLWR
jgi:DNA-binding NarL/FixJ family response regulator